METLKCTELALIYNALETCLKSGEWDSLSEPIEGTMYKINLQLKQRLEQ